jgi:hypothetical protein
MDVFISYHQRVEVEVFNIQCHVSCTVSRYNTIHMHLHQCEIRHWSSNITRIMHYVPTNHESCTMYLCLILL